MSAYFKSFDIKRVGADGFLVNLPGETLNVSNISTGASLGTVQGDNDGNVASASISASDGDIIEFTSGTYPGVFRQTVAAVQLEAFTNPVNNWSTFVAEDLTTANPSLSIDVYLRDANDPKVAPILLGSGKPGESVRASYPSPSVEKTLTLSVVGKDANNKASGHDLDLADSQDIVIGAVSDGLSFRVLAEHYDDAMTTGTVVQDLYSDTIDAGTLSRNGERLVGSYHGILAANAHTKEIFIDLDGNTILNASTVQNDKKWELDVQMVRVDAATARIGCEFTVTGDSPTIAVAEVGSLDFTADFPVTLQARTTAGAGDVTATFGSIEFRPSAYPDALTDETGITLTTESGSVMTA